MDLASLLRLGYFPKELPPPFSTRVFGDYVAAIGRIEPNLPSGKTLITRPAVHNLARPSGARRRLQVPNPFSYYQLARLLEQGWGRLEKHFEKSLYSTSIPVTDTSGTRALRRQLDGTELAVRRAETRRASRYLLRTDISRFYGSIYTHSIPWALDGKATAKKSRKGGLANNLDASLRNSQDGQTLGIAVGPDASLVVAEVLACAVDKELQNRGLFGMRFMDDYEIGFLSRSGAEAGLATVEEVLAEFELAINPRKTSINKLPVELDRLWAAEIKTYPFKEGNVAGRDLLHYFNHVFELKRAYPSDAVLSYAVSRLRSIEIDDRPLLQNLICQCALAEPGAMESVVTLLQEKMAGDLTDAIDKLIASTIAYHAPLSHGSELAWSLWALIWFKRAIPARIARRLQGNRDPAVIVLSLHAKELGLIPKSVSLVDWSMLEASSLYDSNWLLAYEAECRGWLPSNRKKYVDADPNFSGLKQAGVSFYEPDVSAPTKFLLWWAEAAEVYE
jgi:hypothetical protein